MSLFRKQHLLHGDEVMTGSLELRCVSAFDTRIQAQLVAGCNCTLLSLQLKHVCLDSQVVQLVVLLTCIYNNCIDNKPMSYKYSICMRYASNNCHSCWQQ